MKNQNRNQNKKDLKLENKYLKQMISIMPENIFWKDREGKFLGCNDNILKMHKLKRQKEIIGKTYRDFFDEETAEKLRKVDEKIMTTDKSKVLEEISDLNKIYLTHKKPIHDEEGNVVGLLGISIECDERLHC